MIFKGVCTALVTPFDKNGNIDFKSLKKLVEFQIENNVSAILILGSTGESFAINKFDRVNMIKFVKHLLPKKVKLVVGAGSNKTSEVIDLVNISKNSGADCCLVVTPYYNKCTQKGIFQHYKTIVENTNCPIIVYNVPSRTGVNILPKTMEKIQQLNNIVGLKEANSNIEHILDMQKIIKVPFYCGNDNLNVIFKNLNCSGFISVTSNAYPKQIVQQYESGDIKIHEQFYNFNKLMFCEPNPIPIKYVLSKLKLIKNYLCLPLTPLENKHRQQIEKEMICNLL